MLTKNKKNNKKKKVIFTDRDGYPKRLQMSLMACSNAFGTEDYKRQIRRLIHDIRNIKDGPNLRDQVNNYERDIWRKNVNKRLEEWKKQNTDLKDELQIVQDEEFKIEEEMLPELFDFIDQLLEDNDFGTYMPHVVDEEDEEETEEDDEE
jgi:hypothetical protein